MIKTRYLKRGGRSYSLVNLGAHSFSTHAKFSEKQTFLPPDNHTFVNVHGVRNVSFSKNLAYVLNE